MFRKKSGLQRKIIISAAVAFAVVSCSVAVYAISDSKSIKSKENVFIPAQIENAVQENGDSNTDPENKTDLEWSTPDEGDTDYTVKKEVKILNADKDNENNTDAYIRVCLIPRWVITVGTGDDAVTVDAGANSSFPTFGNLTDININDCQYTMGDVTFTLDSNWADYWFFNPNDGYFYYKSAVKPGDTTELLLTSVSVPVAEKDGIYADADLEVDVLSDSIQTGGGAVAARWANVVEDESTNTISIKTTTTENTDNTDNTNNTDGTEGSDNSDSSDNKENTDNTNTGNTGGAGIGGNGGGSGNSTITISGGTVQGEKDNTSSEKDNTSNEND